jgi:hypothetical protein
MIIEADSDGHGLYAFDGTSSGTRFTEPVDVDIDGNGNIFVIDRGSARVLRFLDELTGVSFFEEGLVNRINNEKEPVLSVPTRGAVLDTIVYVSDPPNSALRRYERRNK